MTDRVGVCGSCRARFQIPASFTPNRAKCRTCGGVVEITPPTPAPRRASPPVPPAPAPAPVVAAPPPPAPPEPVAPVALVQQRGVLLPALLAVGALAVLALGAWIFLGSKNSESGSEKPAPPPVEGEKPR